MALPYFIAKVKPGGKSPDLADNIPLQVIIP